MVEESIKNSVISYLKKVQANGVPVSYGVIYGSQATGKAGKWSDIDLAVVSPRFDGMLDRKDFSLLWRLIIGSDSRIEPLPVGEKEWESDDPRPVIEMARREGEIVRIP
jgi:predicted nucleotidyltransferase